MSAAHLLALGFRVNVEKAYVMGEAPEFYAPLWAHAGAR